MNIYKEFVQRLRKLTLEDEYLVLIGDITPNLRNYVRLLSEIKFVDGVYHTYYGEVKTIVKSFIDFNEAKIDHVLKEADKYSNVLDKNEALCLMETTIGIHVTHQIDFGKEFLPITCSTEKKIYDEVMEKYKAFVHKLYDLRSQIERLDRPEKLIEFAKEHFKTSIIKTSEIFKFAHVYISLMLVDRTEKIKVSLEEILLRLSNNLRNMKRQRDENLRNLLQKLYEKNKEYLVTCRQSRINSVESAEISHSIDAIREKIETTKFDTSLAHLEEEVTYWKGKVNDFNGIKATVDKIKLELKEVTKQEDIYKSLECKEFPGQKQEQWEQIGRNCREMKIILKEKLIEVGKVIITFFGVRGANRITCQDNISSFYLDEYNHQVYQLTNSVKQYHRTCVGDFKEISDSKKYFYDEYGRHIYENNDKYYQLAPCTSLYKLSEDGLLNKVTKDGGQTMSINHNCKLNKNDWNYIDILPTNPRRDNKSKLEPDVVKYLWENLGHILPEALQDTGRDKSKNPIHYLAHKILMHKYSRTRSELIGKKKEAQAYRADICKERKEKAFAASKAWKSRQVKRRKPEESDDTEDRAAYTAQITTQQFIKDFSYYDD